jgi:hypothetical protein
LRIGAVIVAYNAAEDIGACLDSCLSYSGDLEAGILVVDNASADSTVAQARRAGVKVIANPGNLGFAAAANQGIRELPEAEAVLLLNPDVVLLASPRMLANAILSPGAGAACGILLGLDGQAQTGFSVRCFPTAASLSFEVLGINRVFPRNPVNRRWRALDLDLSAPCVVEQPAGACFLVLRECWSATDGFDEGFYPVWFEDVDFLLRLRQAGWKAVFTPDFSAQHAGGRSFSSISWGERRLYWYGSLLRYVWLHFSAPERWLVCGSVIAAMAPRAVMGMVLERSTRPLCVCGRVVRLAARVLRGDCPDRIGGCGHGTRR